MPPSQSESQPHSHLREQKPLKRSVNSGDESGDGAQPKKITKVHPFFSKPSTSDSSSVASFKWQSRLGPAKSCLYGTHLSPCASRKVAAFDLDGTVIKSNLKNKDRLEWAWWSKEVPGKLKEVARDGCAVVLVSNQGIKPKQLEEWKKKIPLIAAAIPGVPFRIFAATAKDAFRKPLPGMWDALELMFKEEDGVIIDKTASFFVGDAAGRKGDFAGTDRKWAENIDVQFFTPEEYFHSRSAQPYTLVGFRPPISLSSSSSPVVLPAHQELVVLVGYPCLGKSTYFRRHFSHAVREEGKGKVKDEEKGYVHINQDTLGSRPKCVKAAEEALGEGKSVVVDNTNRDVQTRKYYIDIAKKMGVPARCFVLEGSVDLAWHNNIYRAFILPPSVAEQEPKRTLLPYSALTSFRDAYEPPSVKEGFTSVETVQWAFEGGEAERRRWGMWLQIDGK